MERVSDDVGPLARGTDIVCEAADWRRLAGHVKLLPPAEEANEEVPLELAVKDLGEEVEVADEGRLQDDRDVAGVEELDRVWESLSTGALAVQLKLDAEALRVYKMKLVRLK